MRHLYAALLAVVLSGGCRGDGSGPPQSVVPATCGDGACDFAEWGICPEDCPICGDGACSDGEEVSCDLDCSVCGDGVCTDNEFAYGCASDCFTCINLLWMAVVNCMPENCGMQEDVICAHCGDGECEPGEVETGCGDCGDPVCGDGECQVMEWGVCEDCADECCGDGFCGEWEGEFGLCPEDCDECGDGTCDVSEIDFCNIDCRPFEG